MKILFPCQTNPYFDSSALGNRYESLINGLIENDVEVILVVTGGYTSFNELKSRGKTNSNPNLKVEYTICSLQSTLWQRRINKYILAGIFGLFTHYKLKRYYKTSIDFLWLTGGDIVIRESLLKNLSLLKGKTIIELSEYQDVIDSQGYLGNVLQRRGNAKYTNITMEALNHIDYFVVMTKTLLAYYKGLTKNTSAKFLHLPMTVDLDRFNHTLPLDSNFKLPYIAFIGAMYDAKDGVNVLIEAFYRISNKYSDYKLYLVGPWGYDTPGHQAMIKKYKLEDKVFWMGEYDKTIIPSIIKNASLLVLPRLDSKQTQGGFPTKLGEYLATGNPVCATTVGELPDYLTDGVSVYFAKPGSVDSFAIAMNRALSDPAKARLVGATGREVAEKHFNKDIQAKILLNFLKKTGPQSLS